jgi:hypothetical protein
MDTATGSEQLAKSPVGDELLEQLPTAGIEVERGAIMDRPARDDRRGDGEIAIRRIGGRADIALIDFRLGRGLLGNAIIGSTALRSISSWWL